MVLADRLLRIGIVSMLVACSRAPAHRAEVEDRAQSRDEGDASTDPFNAHEAGSEEPTHVDDEPDASSDVARDGHDMEPPLDPEDDAVDGGPDVSEMDAGDHCEVMRPVDLLLVIDNSPSMAEEQGWLFNEIPAMVRALATGDANGDGVAERAPLDLHVGVITPDLGTAPSEPVVPRCEGMGDDALLQGVGCVPSQAQSRLHLPATASSDEVSIGLAGLSCTLARIGIDGCSYGQPLEAVLKALTPSSSSLRFPRNTRGHADGANSGFLREDSLLVVMILADDDDCSVPDENSELTTWSGGRYADIERALRCSLGAGFLQPVERYARGLRALRPKSDGLIIALVAGTPLGLDETSNLSEIVEDPRLQYQVVEDQSGARKLSLLCENTSARATPAPRLMRTAMAFEDRAIIGSICQASLGNIAVRVLGKIGSQRACVEPQQ